MAVEMERERVDTTAVV